MRAGSSCAGPSPAAVRIYWRQCVVEVGVAVEVVEVVEEVEVL
jgi:hypothetical protein